MGQSVRALGDRGNAERKLMGTGNVPPSFLWRVIRIKPHGNADERLPFLLGKSGSDLELPVLSLPLAPSNRLEARQLEDHGVQSHLLFQGLGDRTPLPPLLTARMSKPESAPKTRT